MNVLIVNCIEEGRSWTSTDAPVPNMGDVIERDGAEYDVYARVDVPNVSVVLVQRLYADNEPVDGAEEFGFRPWDEFEPDWSEADPEHEWHTVDEDGHGRFWDYMPDGIIKGDGEYGVWVCSDYGNLFATSRTLDFFGDWRNSLRHRPNEA